MKLAILVDVHTEQVNEFMQRVEDLVNKMEGRLIFSVWSKNAIRLVPIVPPGEVLKANPGHTPPEASGRVVNHAAEGWNGRWGVDRNDHSGNGASDRLGRAHADVPERSGILRKPNRTHRACGLHASADLGCRRGALALRVRVPSEPSRPQGTLITRPAHDLTYDTYDVRTVGPCAGEPSFTAGML